MKPKNLFGILAFFPSVLFAYQGNFYLSGNVGIFQGNFNNYYLDQTDVIQQNITQLATQQSYSGGVAVGYHQDYGPLYKLGGAIAFNMYGQKAVIQSGAATAAFYGANQIEYNADVLFIPEIKLSSSVTTYLNLGLSLASINDDLTSPVGDTATYTDYHTNKKCLGFTAGLGVSKALSQRISIFTEANYHDYGTVDFNNFQNFTADYTHKAHVYSYGVVLGATYEFI